MLKPADLAAERGADALDLDRAALLSSIVGSVATKEVRQQLREVKDAHSPSGVELTFMQVDGDQGRVGIAMHWDAGNKGNLVINDDSERQQLTNKPAKLERELARHGIDSGVAVAPLLYSALSRGAVLSSQYLTDAERLGVATLGNRESGGSSMYFVEDGKAIRFDTPKTDVVAADVARARLLMKTPRMESFIPSTVQAAHIEERDISSDCTVLTHNGRDAYIYQGQELVFGPHRVALQARTAEGFSLGESEASVMADAERLFTVSDQEALAVIGSQTFQETMTKLRSELAESNAALHKKGKLANDKNLGITSVGIDSVGRNAQGDVISAMVTTVVNNINPKGEVVPVTQKVELRLHEDQAAYKVVDYAGQRYLTVVQDKNGKPILDSTAIETGDSNSSLMYTSFGGSNQRTRVHRSYTDLGGIVTAPGAEARVNNFDVAAAQAIIERRKRGALLTIAEVVGQTDDALTAAAALSEARPDDAGAIADALKTRQQQTNHEHEALTNMPKVVIGPNLPQDVLAFAPFGTILADIPGAVGVVCDQLTLKDQTQPLFAEVTGVIVQSPDGSMHVQTIDPILARKASVTAGVFQTHSNGSQTMLIVAELRTAVGSDKTEQVVGGSTGDRGGLNFPTIVRDEVREEVGKDLGPDTLQQIAVYRANAHTTEDLGFFVASIDAADDEIKEGDAADDAEEGQVHGSDDGERTVVHPRRIPDFDSHDQELPLGRPLDAKTAILAYLGRLHIPKMLARR